jgi:hypothetical protein
MPNAQHHLSNFLTGMVQTASDRLSLVAAGGLISAPWWQQSAQDWSSTLVFFGQILAALLVGSKIVLTWVQIWHAARGKGKE